MTTRLNRRTTTLNIHQCTARPFTYKQQTMSALLLAAAAAGRSCSPTASCTTRRSIGMRFRPTRPARPPCFRRILPPSLHDLTTLSSTASSPAHCEPGSHSHSHTPHSASLRGTRFTLTLTHSTQFITARSQVHTHTHTLHTAHHCEEPGSLTHSTQFITARSQVHTHTHTHTHTLHTAHHCEEPGSHTHTHTLHTAHHCEEPGSHTLTHTLLYIRSTDSTHIICRSGSA